MKFEIFRGKNREFYFRLRADDGKILLSSEGYTTKQSAIKGINAVRQNARDIKRFELKEDKEGRSYFVLKAANHEVIGKGTSADSSEITGKKISAITRDVLKAGLLELLEDDEFVEDDKKEKPCMELCINIIIGTDADGAALASKDDIDEFEKILNGIFGCTEGQCCIDVKVRKSTVAVKPPIPTDIEVQPRVLDKKASLAAGTSVFTERGEFKKVLDGPHAEKECYNIFIVNSITDANRPGEKIAGMTNTLPKQGNIGSMVVGGGSNGSVGNTMAHEVGHALGLGEEEGTEQEGVDKHSSNDKNIMRENPADGDGTNLNELQCERMLQSPLLKVKGKACDCDPKEGVF